MAGVVEVTFWIPAGENHGLLFPVFVSRPHPNLIVSFFREFDIVLFPSLPGESIRGLFKGGFLPSAPEVDGGVHFLHR